MEFQRLVAAPEAPTRPFKSPCIDCGTECRGERCRPCDRIRRNGGALNRCECGAVIRKQHKRCGPCANQPKRPHMVKPENIKFCKGCGTFLKIEGGYRQEHCNTCAPKQDDVRAKRSATMKQRFENPVERAKAQARMAIARAMVDQSKIDRKKQARSLSESRMAWCPVEYRDYYRELRSRQLYNPETKKWYKFGAGPARAKIEKMFGGPLRPFSMTTADAAKSQCRVDGQTVKLGFTHLTILLHLVGLHPDHYASNEDLIRAVYPNPNSEPGDANAVIKSQIHHLRRKGVCIVNAHGKGYRLAPQVR